MSRGGGGHFSRETENPPTPVMLTGIMFNDFQKNEGIDMLTVNKVYGLVQYYM